MTIQDLTLWNKKTIPALGMGCWAIGGPFWAGEQPLGWGRVDDKISIKAIHAGLEAGLRFFDTSDVYGTGHSEIILGKALEGRSEQIIIATKFGNTYNSKTKQLTGTNLSPDYIRWAVQESLNRLKLKTISLYQLHVDQPKDNTEPILDCLIELVNEGKIGAFGWSTDYVCEAKRWVGKENFVSVQYASNIFQPAQDMSKLCENKNLLSIIRSPLAMGLLTSKFDKETNIEIDDVRGLTPQWLEFFKDGKPKIEFENRLNAVREILMSNNRTLAQGSLAWIWAQKPNTLPIPGFRTPEQVIENVHALEKGPLARELVAEVDNILSNFRS